MGGGSLWAGCEIGQIAAITGHTIKSASTIIETYFVRTYPMAQAAIVKYEDWSKARESDRKERLANADDPKSM